MYPEDTCTSGAIRNSLTLRIMIYATPRTPIIDLVQCAALLATCED